LVLHGSSSVCGSHFDDVVVERAFNFLEPVRHAVGNDDNVALGDLARLAAFYVFAANLFRLDVLALNDASAGDQRSGSFEHVDDVGIAGVHLDDSRSVDWRGLYSWQFQATACLSQRLCLPWPPGSRSLSASRSYSKKSRRRKP